MSVESWELKIFQGWFFMVCSSFQVILVLFGQGPFKFWKKALCRQSGPCHTEPRKGRQSTRKFENASEEEINPWQPVLPVKHGGWQTIVNFLGCRNVKQRGKKRTLGSLQEIQEDPYQKIFTVKTITIWIWGHEKIHPRDPIPWNTGWFFPGAVHFRSLFQPHPL